MQSRRPVSEAYGSGFSFFAADDAAGAVFGNFFTKTLWKDKKKPISQPCAKEELADAVGQLFLENCTKPDEARPDGKDNMSCVLIEFKKGFDKVAGTLSKPAGDRKSTRLNSSH